MNCPAFFVSSAACRLGRLLSVRLISLSRCPLTHLLSLRHLIRNFRMARDSKRPIARRLIISLHYDSRLLVRLFAWLFPTTKISFASQLLCFAFSFSHQSSKDICRWVRRLARRKKIIIKKGDLVFHQGTQKPKISIHGIPNFLFNTGVILLHQREMATNCLSAPVVLKWQEQGRRDEQREGVVKEGSSPLVNDERGRECLRAGMWQST